LARKFKQIEGKDHARRINRWQNPGMETDEIGRLISGLRSSRLREVLTGYTYNCSFQVVKGKRSGGPFKCSHSSPSKADRKKKRRTQAGFRGRLRRVQKEPTLPRHTQTGTNHHHRSNWQDKKKGKSELSHVAFPL